MAHPIRVCQHLLKMQTSAGFELGSSEQKTSTPTTCTVLQLFDQGAILSTYISVSCTIPFHVCILFHWKEGEQCDQIRRFIGLTLGNCLNSLATIKLPKSPTFLGNFCKGVKSYHFSSEIILGNFYRHLAIFSGHSQGERSTQNFCCISPQTIF